MAKTAKKEIDGKKLEGILKASGLDKGKVSEEIGYAKGYITDCINTGVMTVVAIKCIEGMYNIPYELYRPMDPEEEKAAEVANKLVSELTCAELSELIYKSVYAAMNHALNNNEGESNE